MTRLCELSAKYGSDKHLGGYTAFYDQILAGRAVRKVLEIGIGTPKVMKHVPGYMTGASIRVWCDYFPGAHVYGLDNDLEALIIRWDWRGHDIDLRLCDQHSRADLISSAQAFGGNFDIIVDDGDHSASSQVFTAVHLMPFLAAGGLYIIEDAAPGCAPPFPHSSVVTMTPDGIPVGHCILIQKGADG